MGKGSHLSENMTNILWLAQILWNGSGSARKVISRKISGQAATSVQIQSHVFQEQTDPPCRVGGQKEPRRFPLLSLFFSPVRQRTVFQLRFNLRLTLCFHPWIAWPDVNFWMEAVVGARNKDQAEERELLYSPLPSLAE